MNPSTDKQTNQTDISIITPIYNECDSIPELFEWIAKVMKPYNYRYEIIAVDDGSNDKSWSVICDLKEKNNNIKGIRFNRNYGKSAALNIGFRKCIGNVIITMDADLQDSPSEIPSLYNKIVDEKFDIVSGWKKKRYDPISKTIPSKFFNYVTRNISGIKLHDFNCGLKAYSQTVIKNINIYGEMHRYIPLIAKWNGFTRIGEQVVTHQKRKYGITKFGFNRFINGFLDLLSITFVQKYQKKPMHFFGLWGLFFFSAGFLITCTLITEKFYNIYNKISGRGITDQPLFYLALVALIIGFQLFLTGFLAEILAMKSSSKQEYLIKETLGL